MTTASQLKTPQRAVAVTAKVALRHVLGLDLRVTGVSHLPKGAHIVAHNLVSPLDAFIVALALQDAGHDAPVIMLDYELARVPLLSWLMTAGALAADARTGPEGVDDPFGIATRALREGRCVITAPEQVVSTSFEVLPIRTGPIRLAGATDKPLVPAATFGAHRLFDPGSSKFRLRRRGASVGVNFGSPASPPDSPDEFLMVRRMLQFDLEALLAQTLDDYPDREEGEAGAEWWPARRGGSAPALLDALESTDSETPTVELWADDRTVTDTRRALLSTTVPVAPQVATWVLDDDSDDDEDVASAFDAPVAAAPTPALFTQPEPEPAAPEPAAPEPAAPEPAAPEPAAPEPAAVEPEVPQPEPAAVASEAAPALAPTPEPAPRESLPDPVPLTGEADVLEVVGQGPAAPGEPAPPVGVDGMLAFDLPGMPRKLLRQTRLEAQGEGRLAVYVGDTALLEDVKIDRRPDKTLFTGVLRDPYRVSSGDLIVDVPAGTHATLVALRGPQRTG